MNKYLVLYLAPVHVLTAWMETPEAERKATEEKMQHEWQQWATSHQEFVRDTAGAGKTIKITADGVSDSRNDIMLYSIIEADSYEAVTAMLDKHPHLQIPEASIEVMQCNTIPGML
jgi:hypothetical protein